MERSDIIRLSAVELGKAIKDSRVSSVEATKAYLDVIGAKDKEIHAYITVDTEGALNQAEEADRRIAAGELTGPLAGVPMAIKDNMCIEGQLTTCASSAAVISLSGRERCVTSSLMPIVKLFKGFSAERFAKTAAICAGAPGLWTGPAMILRSALPPFRRLRRNTGTP